MANDIIPAASSLSIPNSTEVGLSGPAAKIYDTQLAILRTIEKPEYFADLSMVVLSNMELAIREAGPDHAFQIRIQCQQVIAHHVFLGTALIDAMISKNREQFQSTIAGFGSRLANDMVVAVAEAGSERAQKMASGTPGDTVAFVVAGGHAASAAVAAATAAALKAAGNRFATEGVGFFASVFNFLFEASAHRKMQSRWLHSIETLLAASCARLDMLGPCPTVADIGRRYSNDIVILHRTEWDARRPRMKLVFIAAGILIGAWVVLAAIVHGLVKLGWQTVATYRPENVASDAGASSWVFLEYGMFAGAILFATAPCWLLLVAAAHLMVGWWAQYRIHRMVRMLDRGKR